MSKFNLDSKLDLSLRASIANPGAFIEDLDFVYSLLSYPVIAPKPLFSVEVSGRTVLPVFTREEDWEVFVENLSNADDQLEWQTQGFAELMNQVMQYKIDTIGFNLRTSAETTSENLQYYDKEKLLNFMKSYNDVMTDLTSEENQKSDKYHKLYLVPTYLGENEKGMLVRSFLAIKSSDEKQYLPIFDNLQSLVNWYFHPELSKDFKKNKGRICPIRLSEFSHPTNAENRFPASEGMIVNPLDLDEERIEAAIIKWNELNQELK